MVKVREFCCGCSLRSGTLTIAWVTLVLSCLIFLVTVYGFLNTLRRAKLYSNSEYNSPYDVNPPSSYIFAYNVIRSIAGIAVSITTIWALHKNKAKFLNGLFWYFCYFVAETILSEILLIFEPSWEAKLDETNLFIRYIFYIETLESIAFLFLIYLFEIGIMSYFALIVKSFRDYALRNEAQNVTFVGPDATTVGYIAP